MDRNVLNIAHRGLAVAFPENTLEAFDAAIQAGADGIECDVQETADQNFIIMHDPKIQGSFIDRLSLGQINGIKIEGKYRIPMLVEAIDLCSKRTRMVIELKRATSIDYFISILRLAADPEDMLVASFDRDLVAKLFQKDPEIHKALISALPIVKDPAKTVLSAGAEVVIMRVPFVAKELINKMHASSIRIFAWGFPNPDSVRETLKLEVDGVISDFADKVAIELHNRVT